MYRILSAAMIAAVLCLGAGLAHGEAIQRLDVAPQGGAFAINVHPDVLTALQFPSTVTAAFSLQEAPLMLKQHGRVVTIQALPDFVEGTASVYTESFPVGLLFRAVANAEDAARMVEFRDREREDVFERRVALEVERRMIAVDREREREAAELAQKRAQLHRDAEKLATVRLAKGLTVRHRLRPVGLAAREGDLVLRAQRSAWLGDDLALTISIENRSDQPMRLRGFDVRADGLESRAALAFAAPTDAATPGDLLLLTEKGREIGAVVIPDARKRLGAEIAMTLYVGENHERGPVLTVLVVD